MSVVELPKYKIDPNSSLTAEEQSLRLHFKKNRPEVPDLEFPPYRYMPYPQAIYREWEDKGRLLAMRKLAANMGLDLSNPIDYAKVDAEMPEFESRNCGVNDYDDQGDLNQQLRDRNDEDHRLMLGQGWSDTPSGVKAAKDRINKEIAQLAAHRNYEDRNLGDAARRELEAIEDASDQHVLEVPETPIRRGRPATKG